MCCLYDAMEVVLLFLLVCGVQVQPHPVAISAIERATEGQDAARECALGVAGVELVVEVEVHEHGLRRQLLHKRHELGERRHVLDRALALAIQLECDGHDPLTDHMAGSPPLCHPRAACGAPESVHHGLS